MSDCRRWGALATWAVWSIVVGALALGVGACGSNNIRGPNNPGDAGSTPDAGNPDAGSMLATGRFVYATNYADDKVSEFSIDQSTGALTLIGTVLAGNGTYGAFGLTVDPFGKYVYVCNHQQTTLFAFAIDRSTGALTQVGETTFGAGLYPEQVVVDPSGKYAYMTDFANQVFQFSISSTGALQPLSVASIFTTGMGPIGIKIEPTGKYVYVAEQCSVAEFNPCGQVEAFAIGPDGLLSSLGAVPSLGSNGPGSPSLLAVDAAGKNVYVADEFIGTNGSVISQFSIGATGALTYVTAVSPQFRPFDIALTPNDKFAFTTDQLAIVELSVSVSTGAMAVTGYDNTLAEALAIDPGGQVLYTATNGGTVGQFTIDSEGALHPIGAGSVDTESPPNTSSQDIFLVVSP